MKIVELWGRSYQIVLSQLSDIFSSVIDTNANEDEVNLRSPNHKFSYNAFTDQDRTQPGIAAQKTTGSRKSSASRDLFNASSASSSLASSTTDNAYYPQPPAAILEYTDKPTPMSTGDEDHPPAKRKAIANSTIAKSVNFFRPESPVRPSDDGDKKSTFFNDLSEHQCNYFGLLKLNYICQDILSITQWAGLNNFYCQELTSLTEKFIRLQNCFSDIIFIAFNKDYSADSTNKRASTGDGPFSDSHRDKTQVEIQLGNDIEMKDLFADINGLLLNPLVEKINQLFQELQEAQILNQQFVPPASSTAYSRYSEKTSMEVDSDSSENKEKAIKDISPSDKIFDVEIAIDTLHTHHSTLIQFIAQLQYHDSQFGLIEKPITPSSAASSVSRLSGNYSSTPPQLSSSTSTHATQPSQTRLSETSFDLSIGSQPSSSQDPKAVCDYSDLSLSPPDHFFKP